MRVRYAVAAGPPEAMRTLMARLAAAQQLSGIRQLDMKPGLLALADGRTLTIVPASGHAVLIGWVRPRGPEKQARDVTERIEALAGPDDLAGFVEDYWGSYALILGTNGGSHMVFREPSGEVPVFHSEAGGLQLYFSDVETARSVGAVIGKPDPDFARHWLSFPYLRTERTGIANVRELLPGTCREVPERGRAERTRLIWNPWRFAAKDARISNFGEAADALRKETLATMGARPLPTPTLLQLSGGLDSSILAASLSATGARFEAVNFATLAPDGDERFHARAVAEKCSIALTELVERDDPMDLALPAEKILRPGINPVLLSFRKALEAHAQKLGADTLLDGAGGDNIFCYLTTTAPVVDAFQDRGFRKGCEAAGFVAALAGATLWSILKMAARKRIRGHARPYWKRDGSFLRTEALLMKADRHPWLDAPAGTSIGKCEHVEAIVHIQHFLDRRSSITLGASHPLLSQPLLELCLRIPSWLWIQGGRDRAVARAAFRDLLPAQVLNRRLKGSLESLFFRALGSGRAQLRPLLLGGELRRLGIIDAAAVEEALKDGAELPGMAYVRLTEIAALELWLRSWRS